MGLRSVCTSVINYNNLSTGPPENVRLMLTRNSQSASIACTAEARPEPTFKIFFNCEKLVQTDPTYIIPEVNRSHVGIYKCVAENILGNSSSDPELLLDPDLFTGKITYPIRVYNILFIIFCKMAFSY